MVKEKGAEASKHQVAEKKHTRYEVRCAGKYSLSTCLLSVLRKENNENRLLAADWQFASWIVYVQLRGLSIEYLIFVNVCSETFSFSSSKTALEDELRVCNRWAVLETWGLPLSRVFLCFAINMISVVVLPFAHIPFFKGKPVSYSVEDLLSCLYTLLPQQSLGEIYRILHREFFASSSKWVHRNNWPKMGVKPLHEFFIILDLFLSPEIHYLY